MSSHPTKLKGKNTSHHKEFHKKALDFSGVLLEFCTLLKRFRKKQNLVRQFCKEIQTSRILKNA